MVLSLWVGIVFFVARLFYMPGVWDGKQRISVVLASPEMVLVSYTPATERLAVWKFPGNLQMEVTRGYGTYEARAVAGLDNLEKKNGQLIRESVGYFLGLNVDSYLLDENIAVPWNVDNGWVKSRLRVGLVRKLMGKSVSTMSVSDLWRLWRAVGKVRADKVEVIDLAKTNVVHEVDLPGGVRAYQADLQQVSALVQRYMTDEVLVNENSTVLVFNSTGGFGLGGVFSRMLTNVGVRVVGIEDDDRKREVSSVEVRSAETKNTGTVKYIEKLLGVKAVEEPWGGARGDVIVRLGSDYQERMRGEK